MVTVYFDDAWHVCQWDAWKVGCFFRGEWCNMATFEAYCFDD